ncbi:hypothetical protein OUZ56_000191 [Daphnia magna]|uniref:Uncharacterized protein n=1 Tax=Daphnia magna TaxID=35525 RepID=A0ABQ9ZYY4_9CRUS|nr:hypothetical protein OUZ56_000191 [Daphnia magna]
MDNISEVGNQLNFALRAVIYYFHSIDDFSKKSVVFKFFPCDDSNCIHSISLHVQRRRWKMSHDRWPMRSIKVGIVFSNCGIFGLAETNDVGRGIFFSLFIIIVCQK